ncbi:MAG TPA: hypothetical protein DEF47_02510 [Herpetosiphon sp.]|uniref:Peptidase S8 and S53 subtilisin kexin sedolisin n=1 Tax=Herpetosiphon aurantiacus (strain ATCC 23779 / DSM 785 / 114-95) TaxID=316274 RepID=A9B6W6_HERA2|nr:S8 family serine peptidase [Herpetosiphon sp.]ABX05834.1 peptidase S8 and S53 subtilisin kexin sedolisin [Herpetosiphon aurantiacus DSM 785]HBW48761.1 hypothetical protein [Herpetosiphon sp.]
MRLIKPFILLMVLAGFCLPSASANPPDRLASKADSALLAKLNAGQQVPTLVLLQAQVDTNFADRLASKEAKGAAVVAALRQQAQRDQTPLLAELSNRGIQSEGFLSVNALYATLDLASAQWLAEQASVKQLIEDSIVVKVEKPVAETNPAPQAVNTTTWGVNYVKAPEVWAKGITGQGIVIAGEDTGVRWTHAALKSKYRGWDGTNASHDYNWYDGIRTSLGGTNPCGLALNVPCDDNSHGTHTVGTVVGDNGTGEQIGVAPGAKWIACRNMDAGNGTPATYIRCIDWMLAPFPTAGTSAQGDPSKAPHVVNNSWGCLASEGCTNTPSDGIQTSVQNVTNAGIMFVASAGNDGSGCATITTPVAIYPESFVVGSHTSTGAISGFSSRGPATNNGASRIGPDISAPGSSVRSATNGGDDVYGSSSGTSMASPHVVGVVALLWSARPELQGQVDLTRAILQETATAAPSTQTCGGVAGSSIPNNTFGHGYVNALNAIAPTLQGSITVDGTAATSATIRLENSVGVVEFGKTTGVYSTSLPAGLYSATVTVPNETPITRQVTIVKGQVATENFEFGDVTGTVSGHATLNGTGRAGVSITANPGNFTTETNANGDYNLALAPGTYTISSEFMALETQVATVTVVLNQTVIQDFDFATTQTINIQNFRFSPSPITVTLGTSILWRNLDASTHTTTRGQMPFIWDSGDLSQNQDYAVTFDQVGTFSYVCSLHGSMQGTVVVTPPMQNTYLPWTTK